MAELFQRQQRYRELSTEILQRLYDGTTSVPAIEDLTNLEASLLETYDAVIASLGEDGLSHKPLRRSSTHRPAIPPTTNRMGAIMKDILGSRGFLAAYAGVLTTVFAVTVLSGMARPATVRFDVIEVERINVLEPDGTPRLVLSNRARFPGLVTRGTEYEHRTAPPRACCSSTTRAPSRAG